MFKQDYKNYTMGNQQIKITYSSDLVVKKSERNLYPSPHHVIGIGDGTAYYRVSYIISGRTPRFMDGQLVHSQISCTDSIS